MATAVLARPENAVFFNDYVSSDGKITSATANETISFTRPVINLQVRAFGSDINIKLNDGTTKIIIPANNALDIGGLELNTLVIVDNGVDYAYCGMVL